MKLLKQVGTGLLIVIILIQFIPRSVNKSDGALSTAIDKVVPVPDSIHALLVRSCYDCHSNNTNYPWYASVQPIRLYLDQHITEGKKELNLSEFGTYSAKKQYNKLNSMAESVEEETMPLPSYLNMHGNAALTKTEKDALISWVEETRRHLKQHDQADHR